MGKRVCAELGCPVITDATRCATHRRARDKARGTRQQRGYDAAYDAQRRPYAARVAAGETLTCWRCNKPIRGPFHLGHCDDDRSVIHGPEDPACNLAHTRGGCTHVSHL